MEYTNYIAELEGMFRKEKLEFEVRCLLMLLSYTMSIKVELKLVISTHGKGTTLDSSKVVDLWHIRFELYHMYIQG